MDVGHNVVPVNDEGTAAGQTQGDVQHRAVLRGVDVLTGEHRGPAL